MTTVLPPLNSLVRVVLADTEERPSRVEAADGGLLTVAAPWHPAALAPAPGEALAVRWASVRGIHEIAAILVAVERENALALWRVQTEGEVRILQRRRFVRVDAIAPVTVVPMNADADCTNQPQPVLGTIVNLSEGGARCRVEGLTALAAAGLAEDGEVEVRISLGAVVIRVVGIVVRVIPDAPWTPKDAAEVVVSFEAPDHAADLIRRFVLTQQVLARRATRA